MDCLRYVIASRRRSNPFFIFSFLILNLLTGCSDFFHPVDSTPAPTEYTYNYWLLQRTYLFEDELPLLDEQGDSVSELYDKLSDPFTRYVPPSKSEDAITHINTSIVPGDVGMEYTLTPQAEHPLVIYRVYADSPAGRAGIKRYGNILNVNGIDITGANAYNTYNSILAQNKELTIRVAYFRDTTEYKITKEDVYAPTVFVDTINNIEIITITSFKLNTSNREKGSFGELKDYLDSTKNTTAPRLIDLRNNPGGHVNHCTAMAGLFIPKDSIVSTRYWRSFGPDGKDVYNKVSILADSSESGRNGKFLILANRNSASCAEIFASALQEGANIPIAGERTYGKGIGQSTWKTFAGGLSLITNLEFLTPKGNSYNNTGIIPDYPCESATLQCGFEAIDAEFGKSNSTKTALKKSSQDSYKSEPQVLRRYKDIGGAIMNGDSLDILVY